MEGIREPDRGAILVRAFAWADWRALWEVRLAQLAEHGVLLGAEAIPAGPEAVPWGAYEWDLHHLDEVYLCGVGGFWLAWAGALPVGYVGAQNLGRMAEVRRMYVRAEHRRRGIGSHLLSALIAHCAAQGALAIEVWSGPGPGRKLYSRAGFLHVAAIGQEFLAAPNVTGHIPGPDEARLRLELGPVSASQRRLGKLASVTPTGVAGSSSQAFAPNSQHPWTGMRDPSNAQMHSA